MMRAEKRGASYSPPRVVGWDSFYNLFNLRILSLACGILSSSYIYTRQ